MNTGRKLNVHKTFRRRPGLLLNVFCTFNLRPVSSRFSVHQALRSHRSCLLSSHQPLKSLTVFKIFDTFISCFPLGLFFSVRPSDLETCTIPYVYCSLFFALQNNLGNTKKHESTVLRLSLWVSYPCHTCNFCVPFVSLTGF